MAWAPVSALLIQYLYGNGVFSALALVEELLPGTDFIPTACIAWYFTFGRNLAPEEAVSPPDPPPPSAASSVAPERRADSGVGSAGGGAGDSPRLGGSKSGKVVDVDIIDS